MEFVFGLKNLEEKNATTQEIESQNYFKIGEN